MARSNVGGARAWAVAWVMLFPLVAGAADFVSVELSNDRTRLVIASASGEQFAAPMLPEQVEFDQPRISADGRRVGWLALFPNCCTSYPIPLKLVVLDEARRLHTFEGIQMSVFAWCFSPDSRSVAYRQGVLHGSDFQHFELRRIADGRLLAGYEYPHDEAERVQARKKAPSWLRCVPE